MTRAHVAVSILSGQITLRTLSTRTSAAVPQSVERPAAFIAMSTSRVERPLLLAAYATSIGLLAWMWTAGASSRIQE